MTSVMMTEAGRTNRRVRYEILANVQASRRYSKGIEADMTLYQRARGAAWVMAGLLSMLTNGIWADHAIMDYCDAMTDEKLDAAVRRAFRV